MSKIEEMMEKFFTDLQDEFAEVHEITADDAYTIFKLLKQFATEVIIETTANIKLVHSFDFTLETILDAADDIGLSPRRELKLRLVEKLYNCSRKNSKKESTNAK